MPLLKFRYRREEQSIALFLPSPRNGYNRFSASFQPSSPGCDKFLLVFSYTIHLPVYRSTSRVLEWMIMGRRGKFIERELQDLRRGSGSREVLRNASFFGRPLIDSHRCSVRSSLRTYALEGVGSNWTRVFSSFSSLSLLIFLNDKLYLIFLFH